MSGPRRVRSLWKLGSADARAARDEVEAELVAHFQGTVEVLMARGWSEADAHAEARRRFGDEERYRRALERIQRKRRLRSRLRTATATLWEAFRSALRTLRRSPGFSTAVVATLALGIGANAAIFRAVDRLLLTPPEHVERPEEVRVLYQMFASDRELETERSFTYADVKALRRTLPVRLGAVGFGQAQTLGEGERAARVVVARVDSAFLPVLGVRAAVGRDFVPEDHRPGAAAVILLAHQLWRSHFRSDPAVVGSTIRVGTRQYQVIGVLPAGFIGATPPSTDAWIPLEAEAEDIWDVGWEDDQGIFAFGVLARLGSFDRERFATEAGAIFRRTRVDYAVDDELVDVGTASLVPADGPGNSFGATVPVSKWLAGVSLLVLLVACANVANLFLAQSERVTHETAVRVALGAGAGRLRIELLAQSLVLALLAALGAFVLAAVGGEALENLVFGARFAGRARIGRLMTFTSAAALLAAVLSGLLPAVRAPRRDVRAGLLATGRTVTGGGRTTRMLIALQTALSALLLVGATLFLSSFRTAARKDLGFDVQRLLRVRIEREEGEGPLLAQIYEEAEEAVREVPGVLAAARTVAVPFASSYGLQAQLPAGEAPAGSRRGESFTINAVGAGFFATMSVALLSGRAIEAADLAWDAAPVIVVSRGAATSLWPGEDPLGRCLTVGSGERSVPCARVVGVAEDHSQRELTDVPGLNGWVPLTLPAVRVGPTLMVRVDGESPRLVASVRRRILELPSVRYAEVLPMTDYTDRLFRSWKLGATVFSLFAVIALGVAGVGLYGVLSYEVAQRRREIGIRVALGAAGSRVVSHVMRGALATTAAGLAVGLAASVWGAHRVESLLFEVSPRDPSVFLLAAGFLLLIASVAAFVPAWRAARVDPRESLAAE